MKILIPHGGGWNSTYLLWKTLQTTGHDVIAIHYDFGPMKPEFSAMSDYAKLCATETARWLKTHVREFKYIIKPVDNRFPDGTPILFAPIHKTPMDIRGGTSVRPVREGFTATFDGAMNDARYCSEARDAVALGVDEVWVGLDNENTRVDNFIEGHKMHLALAPDVPLRAPLWIWNDPADEWKKAPDGFPIRHFSQFHALPPELKPLVTRCSLGNPESKSCNCIKHQKWRLYHNVLIPNNIPIAEFDLEYERMGGFGIYRDAADPETWTWYDSRAPLLPEIILPFLTGKGPRAKPPHLRENVLLAKDQEIGKRERSSKRAGSVSAASQSVGWLRWPRQR